MAEAKTYWEKLKDPRWQKKRLEVLERAEWKCEHCGDSASTLHVHHGYYEKGLEPWEYHNSTLWALCEGCHETTQFMLRDLHMEMAGIHPADFGDMMAEILAIKSRRRARVGKST